MNEILDSDKLFKEFDFKQLQFTKPIPANGGNYFIKCSFNNNPLYIQPPKCNTKQGITKIGKKFITDLLFTNENESFLTWIENLESHCQKNIYENRESWFDGDMDKPIIEDFFTSPIKVYKSGKYYLLRVNIQSALDKPVIKFYDDNENAIDFTTITEKHNVMSILEVKGIKCSASSFQIEFDLKQVLLLQDTNIFEKCLLKTNSNDKTIHSIPIENNDISQHLEETNHIDTIANDNIVSEIEQNQTDINIIDVEEQEITSSDIQVDTSDTDILGENDDRIDISMNIDINEDTSVMPNNNIENNVTNQDDMLEVVDLDITDSNNDLFKIKERNDVYYEMYREALEKAKVAKKLALQSYLDAKRIKNTYMLDDIDESSDSEFEDE